ncbi:MAG TPA: ATP-binding protein [Terriglobales bacterium]|nr:ATP-binding protein [Terriglobales bacterium]
MNEFRVIVVAPTGRDGELICRLLERMGINTVMSRDCSSAIRAATESAGAFILSDEVLNAESIHHLSEFIAAQPSWSDLPVIVLTSGGQTTPVSEARRRLREPLGNVIVVERPVRPETLASTVQSAIRARARQYQLRDHLRQERLAADALRKSEKLAVAGRLAASIAHEINNPLESVMNLMFLIKSSRSLEEAKHYLGIAEQELQRVVEITTHTLRFHRDTSVAAPVNLKGMLDSVLGLYDRRLRTGNVTLALSVDPQSQVFGSAGELRQVAANLIGNALDAMPHGGTLYIRIGRGAERSNGIRPGVRFVVADTGAGIPESIRGKIMEPFVSTKQDTGTGLGLWLTSEIVRKHRGSVRFKSRLGKGTVFCVFLPEDLEQQS